MPDQALDDFVKARVSGEIKKPSSWVTDGIVYDGLSDDPWTAEDLAAEAIGAGLVSTETNWENVVAEIKKIMES